MEINGLTLNLNVFEANQAQKLNDSYESVANEAERAQGKSLQDPGLMVKESNQKQML